MPAFPNKCKQIATNNDLNDYYAMFCKVVCCRSHTKTPLERTLMGFFSVACASFRAAVPSCSRTVQTGAVVSASVYKYREFCWISKRNLPMACTQVQSDGPVCTRHSPESPAPGAKQKKITIFVPDYTIIAHESP